MQALAELLAIPAERIGSVVAIRGAKFKTPLPKGVVLGGYASHVRLAQTPLLEENELQRILGILRSDRVGRGWLARLRHSWFTRVRHADDDKAPAEPRFARGSLEKRWSPAPTEATPKPPDAESSPPEPSHGAFCIGCGSSLAFEPARPMCRACYQTSHRGKDPATLKRRSCHRCGQPNLGTLAKPICHSCWGRIPKKLQQKILDSLR